MSPSHSMFSVSESFTFTASHVFRKRREPNLDWKRVTCKQKRSSCVGVCLGLKIGNRRKINTRARQNGSQSGQREQHLSILVDPGDGLTPLFESEEARLATDGGHESATTWCSPAVVDLKTEEVLRLHTQSWGAGSHAPQNRPGPL